MIILPDKNTPRSKFLLPLKKLSWTTPSLTQKKNMFGHEDRKLWHIKAKLNDGYTKWHGIFEDRDDFDAFLYAIITGTLNSQPALWNLPNTVYFPEYSENTTFVYAATISFTSAGSNTWNVPGDWNNTSNTIEAIGGGGGGAAGAAANGNRVTGGSGAEYRKLTNFIVSSSSISYTVGSQGFLVLRSAAGITVGNPGADTTFNTTSLIAKAGLGGTGLNGSAPTPPAGGTGGTGGTGFSGGAGGAPATFNDVASGGGGAGGTTANGTAGAAVAANNGASAGGAGGATSGGAGGNGNSGSIASPSGLGGFPGSAGTGINGTVGAGGGGGGCVNINTGTASGGTAGSYGGGGGGSNTKSGGGNSTGASGGSGLIFITYTPVTLLSFNMPMLGM